MSERKRGERRGENWTWVCLECCYYCSTAKSCPALCDPMDCSTPGFPVLHYLPEFAQTHFLWVGDAIHSSYSLSPASLPPLKSFPASGSFPMSLLFASGGQSIEASASASILPMNIQGWFPLGLTGLISLQSKGLSRVFSSTTVQKHQFFRAQGSLWSKSHIMRILLLIFLVMATPLLEPVFPTGVESWQAIGHSAEQSLGHILPANMVHCEQKGEALCSLPTLHLSC